LRNTANTQKDRETMTNSHIASSLGVRNNIIIPLIKQQRSQNCNETKFKMFVYPEKRKAGCMSSRVEK